jgi:subtilisin family serine protease
MRRTSFLVASVAGALAAVGLAGAATNDQHNALQWGPQQIRAEQAWATSTGAGQTIAIVDSGVDLDHPDLAGKIVGGATFTGCATTPGGCGNGDWESAPSAGAPSPHGTHIAGIAAATTGNGIGIAGVARDANLLAVKVLTDAGGSFAEVGAGIRWAADNGADVINLSLGALPGVQALPLVGLEADAKQAIEYAVGRGVVVVAAAGNEFASICAEPSFSDKALCVVATDRNELRASYSNFAVHPSLNIVAGPGGAALLSCADDVVSTVPAGSEGTCSGGRAGYDFYAGTSMAAPHVAGVAALLTAQGRGVDEVYSVLKSTARTPVLGLRGVYTPVYGYGIVDAQAAVAAP